MRVPFHPSKLSLNRTLAGALVLPTLLGALILWSLADRAERSDRVPAAVVNLDEMVTIGKGKSQQTVYAGRLLASELTSPERESAGTLGWELTDAEDAQEGLKDGDYYAVVTIPKEFSRTLSGIQGADPETAGVTVQSNDSSSALVGQISKQVADIATNQLGHVITATYIEGVLSQSDLLKKQLGDAADGAAKLEDGANQLGDGATQLGDGASQLGAGADQLAAGIGRLSSGADQLAGGADRLAGGASRLQGGLGRLGGGARRLDQGANQLASGLRQLDAATDAVAGQAGQLGQIDTSGLQQLADNIGQLNSAAQQLQSLACAPPAEGVPVNQQLCQAAQAVAAGSQLGDLPDVGAIGTSLQSLSQGLPRLLDAIDQASAGANRLTDGTGQLVDGIGRLQDGAGQLAGGASRLAGGARRLSSGADQAQGGATRLGNGADRLATGADRLAGGADQLANGAGQLADGLQKGADKIPSGANAKERSKVIADPVDAASSNINPTLDGETLLTPGMLAVVLWLGAFAIYLIRQGLPAGRLRSAVSPARLTWSGWWPAVLIGAVQAALLFVVTLLFGADLASPVGVALVALAAVAVFTAINQALVSWFGARRGWIVSIAFATLQVVALGGLLPIDTAPGLLQALNEVLPVARAADALSQLTLGGSVGSVASDVLVLVLWVAAALGVTVVAARRQQRLTVADVRRELSFA